VRLSPTEQQGQIRRTHKHKGNSSSAEGSGIMGSKAEKHQLERWNTHFSTVVEQEVLG
jgi:hypothetical protein